MQMGGPRRAAAGLREKAGCRDCKVVPELILYQLGNRREDKEERMVIDADTLLFFEQQPAALPLYEAFYDAVLKRHPDARIKIQKTQISFSNRYIFACVSFLRVKKKKELPDPYLVITLGLPYSLESPRAAVKTEPYPGRWTTHIVIGSEEEVDEELLGWTEEAYCFAGRK